MAHLKRPPVITHHEVYSGKDVPNIEVLQRALIDQRACEPKLWNALLGDGAAVIQQEPSVLTLRGRVVIVGPLRGHFYDLLHILNAVGDPEGSPERPSAKTRSSPQRPYTPCTSVAKTVSLRAGTKWLFLGDVVDGAPFSTQVLAFLMALKKNHPDQIHILRGRRETVRKEWEGRGRSSCSLKAELTKRYGWQPGVDVEELWASCGQVFKSLPVAAVVNSKYWCASGGIGPRVSSPSDLMAQERFKDTQELPGVLMDTVWADPMDDEDEELQANALFLHNYEKGCSYYYAFNAAVEFLRDNQLLCIIRGVSYPDSREVPPVVTRTSHNSSGRPWHYQYSPFDPGYRLYRKSPLTNFPSVIGLFSAPRFLENENRGAVLVSDADRLDVRQFEHVPAPFMLPGMRNGFTWSLPFVASQTATLAQALWGNVGGRDADRLVHVHDQIRDGQQCDKQEYSLLSFERMYKLVKRRERERNATIMYNGLAGLCYGLGGGAPPGDEFDFSDIPDVQPYHRVSGFSRLTKLVENWQVIRKEALEIAKVSAPAERKVVNVHGDGITVRDLETEVGWIASYQAATGRNPRWLNFPLIYPQGQFEGNSELCPQTSALLSELSRVSQVRCAGFSLLAPGTTTRVHRDRTGPSDSSLAFSLGVVIPSPQSCSITVGGAQEFHANGKAVLYDGTLPHNARNDHSEEDRIVLYVDFVTLPTDPLPRPPAQN
eukprot:Hpha_TRINITY_DN8648_c0_g1::TRINITY_DN8648_c0_g1_i1::g.168644::m.168644/K04348/PPP3C, CNA; serine/threonine-protein phosphatase 2B catalytic subunit